MLTKPGPLGPLKAAVKPTGSCQFTFFADDLHMNMSGLKLRKKPHVVQLNRHSKGH